MSQLKSTLQFTGFTLSVLLFHSAAFAIGCIGEWPNQICVNLTHTISCERTGGGYLVHERTVTGDNWSSETYPPAQWAAGVNLGERDAVNFGIGTGGGPAGGEYLTYSSIQLDGPQHLQVTRSIGGKKSIERVENLGQLIQLSAEDYEAHCRVIPSFQ